MGIPLTNSQGSSPSYAENPREKDDAYGIYHCPLNNLLLTHRRVFVLDIFVSDFSPETLHSYNDPLVNPRAEAAIMGIDIAALPGNSSEDEYGESLHRSRLYQCPMNVEPRSRGVGRIEKSANPITTVSGHTLVGSVPPEGLGRSYQRRLLCTIRD